MTAGKYRDMMWFNWSQYVHLVTGYYAVGVNDEVKITMGKKGIMTLLRYYQMLVKEPVSRGKLCYSLRCPFPIAYGDKVTVYILLKNMLSYHEV